jgi:hypothetical protein
MDSESAQRDLRICQRIMVHVESSTARCDGASYLALYPSTNVRKAFVNRMWMVNWIPLRNRWLYEVSRTCDTPDQGLIFHERRKYCLSIGDIPVRLGHGRDHKEPARTILPVLIASSTRQSLYSRPLATCQTAHSESRFESKFRESDDTFDSRGADLRRRRSSMQHRKARTCQKTGGLIIDDQTKSNNCKLLHCHTQPCFSTFTFKSLAFGSTAAT